MKLFCLELFDQMLQNIEGCQEAHGLSERYIQCCFSKSETVATLLEEKVKQYAFSNEEEEIWFFKIMKPQFFALIEFFSLMYKGELFAKYESDLAEYWLGEKEYVSRFFTKHQKFYQYYKTGRTHLDREYFLSPNSKDKLVASLMAREKYLKYVEEKLVALMHQDNQ